MRTAEINLKLDLTDLQATVELAESLNDNPKVFKELAKVARAKAQVKDALAQVEEIEAGAKAIIKKRAAADDPEWSVIVGNGYKVKRSATGAVFKIVDEAKADPFIERKPSVKTDAVKDYQETEGKLPDGIVENDDRGERIEITVKEDA